MVLVSRIITLGIGGLKILVSFTPPTDQQRDYLSEHSCGCTRNYGLYSLNFINIDNFVIHVSV